MLPRCLGWFYNHRTKGYNGSEALPNIRFWRTLPGAPRPAPYTPPSLLLRLPTAPKAHASRPRARAKCTSARFAYSTIARAARVCPPPSPTPA